jgi:hypothetical protein
MALVRKVRTDNRPFIKATLAMLCNCTGSSTRLGEGRGVAMRQGPMSEVRGFVSTRCRASTLQR